MTVEYRTGNIWNSGADAIVVTVNCKGIMGAGLAKQCKERHAEVFIKYQADCRRGAPSPGDLATFGTKSGKYEILAAFTKDDWRQPSELRWVDNILKRLVASTPKGQTVAVPPLGCGLGGLEWADVGPLVHEHLATAEGTFLVYGPAISRKKERPMPQGPVTFFRASDEWGRLGNMAMKGVPPLTIDGREYRTSEHAYQALSKLIPAGRADLIPALNERGTIDGKQFVYDALGLGPRNGNRADATAANEATMLKVLRAKAEQDREFRALLLKTGTRQIIELSTRDTFWGQVKGSGQNRLGACLMQVRREIAGTPEPPAKSEPVCIIHTRKSVSTYHDLDDAWADIARLAEKHYFVGVVGSRRRNDPDALSITWGWMEDRAESLASRVAFVSGGCGKGADRFCKDLALANGFPYIEFPAQWETYPRRAGHVRNEHIARCADEVLALPATDRTGGTESAIEWCKKLNRRLVLLGEDGWQIQE